MAILGARPVTAPGWTGRAKQGITIIDCDVHPQIPKMDLLFPYLPRVYQEYVSDQGWCLPTGGYQNFPKQAGRTDLVNDCDANRPSDKPDRRNRSGCDVALLREEHLDVWNVDYALLIGLDLQAVSVIPDADYAAALASAYNDWLIDHWIEQDNRLKMCMVVSTSDPKLVAKEIDRLGPHPGVVGVVLTTGAQRPYGNRYYDPIWQACERNHLVPVIHPGCEGVGMAGPMSGVGYPTYYLEKRLTRPTAAMAHCVSLICEGTFEKFPDLKVAVVEVDQFWVPGFLWQMDADWKSLRSQTPWVKSLPSEYFRRHIRVGSQPLVEPPSRESLVRFLEEMHANEVLIYCSDWPHWDWDDPATTFPRLPEHLHQRIFADNARELFEL